MLRRHRPDKRPFTLAEIVAITKKSEEERGPIPTLDEMAAMSREGKRERERFKRLQMAPTQTACVEPPPPSNRCWRALHWCGIALLSGLTHVAVYLLVYDRPMFCSIVCEET